MPLPSENASTQPCYACVRRELTAIATSPSAAKQIIRATPFADRVRMERIRDRT